MLDRVAIFDFQLESFKLNFERHRSVSDKRKILVFDEISKAESYSYFEPCVFV